MEKIMKVKVIGKEATESGWAVMDPILGAVKIQFNSKVIIVTADGKIQEHQITGETK